MKTAALGGRPLGSEATSAGDAVAAERCRASGRSASLEGGAGPAGSKLCWQPAAGEQKRRAAAAASGDSFCPGALPTSIGLACLSSPPPSPSSPSPLLSRTPWRLLLGHRLLPRLPGHRCDRRRRQRASLRARRCWAYPPSSCRTSPCSARLPSARRACSRSRSRTERSPGPSRSTVTRRCTRACSRARGTLRPPAAGSGSLSSPTPDRPRSSSGTAGVRRCGPSARSPTTARAGSSSTARPRASPCSSRRCSRSSSCSPRTVRLAPPPPFRHDGRARQTGALCRRRQLFDHLAGLLERAPGASRAGSDRRLLPHRTSRPSMSLIPLLPPLLLLARAQTGAICLTSSSGRESRACSRCLAR